MALIYGQG